MYQREWWNILKLQVDNCVSLDLNYSDLSITKLINTTFHCKIFNPIENMYKTASHEAQPFYHKKF